MSWHEADQDADRSSGNILLIRAAI